MSQGPIPIDPRLLGAVKRALGRMPAVPHAGRFDRIFPRYSLFPTNLRRSLPFSRIWCIMVQRARQRCGAAG